MLLSLHHYFIEFENLLNTSVPELISRYRDYTYPIIFIGTFFEGETFVLFLGYAAQKGYLDLPLAIVMAWLGSFAGDQLWFQMGRRFGKPFLHRRPHWVLAAGQALALAEKYDVLFILTFRFMYGIRNISGFALGLSKITSTRFLVFNFIAAGIWAVIFSGAGYLFGHVSQAVLGKWAEVVGLSLLGCLIATSWAAILIQRRHMKRRGLKFNFDEVPDPVTTRNRQRETIGKE